MKKFFGEYPFIIKRAAKKFGVEWHGIDMSHCFDVCPTLQKPDRSLGLDGDMKILSPIVGAEEEVLAGKAVHYFIESEALAEKLPTMLKGRHRQYLEAICSNEAHGETDGFFNGILHTCGKNATATLFQIWGVGREQGCSLIFLSNRDGIDYFESRTGFAKTPGAPSLLKSLDLIFAMGLYIKCFPEAVVEGFPECAKHPAHYKGERCASIGTVPQIIERDGPTPHFRSGHFRVLSSPVFTKSRFKVIFIEDTFVKGQAKTIIDKDAQSL